MANRLSISILLGLLLGSFSHLYAQQQNERRLSIPTNESKSYSTLRGVIIGISDYKEINDLHFADKDAQAIFELLKQSAKTDTENLKLFTDEEATNKQQLLMEIYHMLNQSKSGDRFIFYFAGHGDVQNVLGKSRGFLLLNQVSTDTDYFVGDALHLKDLQELLGMATANGVEVVIITDACRSGKLISSEENTQATLQVLQQRWGNMIKIVSCEAHELSQESEKWGGGHGVFTHYLLKGISEQANDRNSDEKISLRELRRYLEDEVAMATHDAQNPRIVADNLNTPLLDGIALKKRTEDTKEATSSIPFEGVEIVNSRGIIPPPQKPQSRLSTIYFKALEDAAHEKRLIFDAQKHAESAQEHYLTLSEKDFGDISNTDEFVVAAHPQGNKVYTTGEDKVIRMWEESAQGLHLLKKAGVSSALITDMIVSEEQQRLYAVDYSGKLIVMDANTLEQEGAVSLGIGKVYSISLSADGNMLYIGSDEGVFTLPLQEETFNKNKLLSLGFTEGSISYVKVVGQTLLAVTEDQYLHFFDLSTNIHSNSILLPDKVSSLEVSVDQKYLFIGYENSLLEYCHLKRQQIFKGENLGIGKINAIKVGAFSRLLIVSGEEHKTVVFDWKKPAQKEYLITPQTISGSAFIQDYSKLVLVTYAWKDNPSKIIAHPMDYTFMLPKYANQIYEKYLSTNEPQAFKEEMKSQYFQLLNNYAQSVLTPLTSGTESYPALEEIKQAQQCLNTAKVLYRGVPFITQKVERDIMLLTIYETLVSNDLSKVIRSVSTAKTLIKIHPDAGYPHNLLNLLYNKINELEKAKKSAKTAMEKVPNWTEPIVNLGKTYLLEGDYVHAIEQFNAAIALKPEVAKSHLNLAMVYLKLGDTERAEENFLLAIEKDSLNPMIYAHYAGLALGLKRYKDTEHLLDKCRLLNANELVLNRLEAQLLIDKFCHLRRDPTYLRSAYDLLQENIKNNPKDYQDYKLVYDMVQQIADIPEARDFLISQTDMNDLQGAVLSLLNYNAYAAHEANPYDPTLLVSKTYARHLFSVYSGLDRPAPEMMVEELKNKHFNGKSTDYFVGWYYHQINEVEQAESYYQKALTINPELLPAYLGLWDLYQSNKPQQLEILYQQYKEGFMYAPVVAYRYALYTEDLEYMKKLRQEFPGYYPVQVYLENNYFIKTKQGHSYNEQWQMERKDFFTPEYIKVQREGKYGLLTLKGELILDTKYSSMDLIQGEVVTTTEEDSTPYVQPIGRKKVTLYSKDQSLPIKTSFMAVSVVNDSMVWASGNNGMIARTTDGGENWYANRMEEIHAFQFSDIIAFSEDQALVVSATNPARIYKTEDGGLSWKICYENTSGEVFLNGIIFWNEREGFVYGDPVDGQFLLLKTTDGGATWNQIQTAPKALAGDIGFAGTGNNITVQGETIWMVAGGTQGSIFHSEDQGATWSRYALPKVADNFHKVALYSIEYADDQNAIVTGIAKGQQPGTRQQYSFKTGDGGESWKEMKAGEVTDLYYQITTIKDKRMMIAAGMKGIDYSTDQGKTWTKLNQKYYYTFEIAPSGKYGWVLGKNGRIQKLIFSEKEEALLGN
ncbi:caspase family protein [Algivirga pacifica]|uniref:Tetratricopeptide repeat-containing protein n=1 Tax=Algivirga pacifica TaxID=1162670 RepID=A0ABP9D3A4_9BACT